MLLSVIVPVYNGEEFLEECLNSLIKQGFCEGGVRGDCCK